LLWSSPLGYNLIAVPLLMLLRVEHGRTVASILLLQVLTDAVYGTQSRAKWWTS
jgi:uncharacterized membrane protein YgaE (UPF0421/DUF939 family)